MGTPTQEPATPAASNGVETAEPTSGAEFLRQLMAKSMGEPTSQPVQAPVEPPVVVPPPPPLFSTPQAPAPQPTPPQAPVPAPASAPASASASASAPASAPAPAPAPAPATQQPTDFTARYAGEQPSADPIASLQQLPPIPEPPPVPPPQNLNESQNHSWAAMRAQMTAARRMAEDFRNKYNQLLESSQKFQEEKLGFGEALNKKDAEIKALQDEIGRTDLTRSPAFQEKYDQPIYEVCDEIASTLVSNGYNQEQAQDLAKQVVQADKSDLPNLLSELPSFVQGLIAVKAEAADNMFLAREKALEDWKQSAEGLAAVEARGSAIVNAQKVDGYVGKALDIIHTMPVGNGKPPAYQVTDPTFVADRDAKEQQFRAWAQQAPMEQLYAAALEGFMAPKTYEMLDNIMRENAELRQALGSRQRIAPPVAPMNSAVWGQTPPAPPPRPTIRTAGYEEIPPEEATSSRSFMQRTFDQFMQQPR